MRVSGGRSGRTRSICGLHPGEGDLHVGAPGELRPELDGAARRRGGHALDARHPQKRLLEGTRERRDHLGRRLLGRLGDDLDAREGDRGKDRGRQTPGGPDARRRRGSPAAGRSLRSAREAVARRSIVDGASAQGWGATAAPSGRPTSPSTMTTAPGASVGDTISVPARRGARDDILPVRVAVANDGDARLAGDVVAQDGGVRHDDRRSAFRRPRCARFRRARLRGRSRVVADRSGRGR